MSSLIYKGDIGAQIVVDTKNTTAATTTSFTLHILKPSGATANWAGSMNYTTGLLTYSTVAGDLNESGQFVTQAKSTSSGGTEVLTSDEDTFTVYEPIY